MDRDRMRKERAEIREDEGDRERAREREKRYNEKRREICYSFYCFTTTDTTALSL